MYFLMIKTHNTTGLKYLCQTRRKDPFKYLGSGVYWRKHLKKHGEDITTEVVGVYETQQELSVAGVKLSEEYGVVRSDNWANLVPEEGTGGDTSKTSSYKKGMKSRKSMAGENNPMYGKEGYWKNKVGPTVGKHWFNNGDKEVSSLNCPEGYTEGRLKETCPHCSISVEPMNKKWHFDYCNKNPNQKERPKSHLIGLKWWNNGIEELKARECPEGYTRGRVSNERFKNKAKIYKILC